MSEQDNFMKTLPIDIQSTADVVLDAILFADSNYERRAIIAKVVLAERHRCADVARRYLEDIAGCNMNEDEPEKIAAAIMDPKWEPPPL